MTQGTRTISFVDDTEHQRFKQVAQEGTKLYISAFEVSAGLVNPGSSPGWESSVPAQVNRSECRLQIRRLDSGSSMMLT
jgi:hypothetical protein